jgi:hypothetical protein
VGAAAHWVAVPKDRAEQPVQCFGAFTADLYAVAAWLRQCPMETVVMESTGVYWIALFEVGFQERAPEYGTCAIFCRSLLEPLDARPAAGQ